MFEFLILCWVKFYLVIAVCTSASILVVLAKTGIRNLHLVPFLILDLCWCQLSCDILCLRRATEKAFLNCLYGDCLLFWKQEQFPFQWLLPTVTPSGYGTILLSMKKSCARSVKLFYMNMWSFKFCVSLFTLYIKITSQWWLYFWIAVLRNILSSLKCSFCFCFFLTLLNKQNLLSFLPMFLKTFSHACVHTHTSPFSFYFTVTLKNLLISLLFSYY